MARSWEDSIIIPTYELGPEDPYPPLFVGRRSLIHPGSRIVYPYPLQEEMYNRKADKKWRIFSIENEFLRIGVLPDLGGRVLSVFDKIANREALYRNHVVKYARIGIRGAFLAGGIEWNFPNGHTVTTSSPVDCSLLSTRDGSASVMFGDLERVSRMRWSVTLTLRPGNASFEARIRLDNRTALPNRFWFWANSAAPVSPGMQYRTTATRVSDLFNILSFPVSEGTDISWDRNHPDPQDMFSLNHRADFGSWYNHDIECGMVNAADRTESRGLKFFTWGTGDDGGIWEKRLTDEDGFYSEMQSGRFATQRIWGILPPFTEESWTETWYPIARIGPPDFANREIALSLLPAGKPDRLRLGVHSTREVKGAHLSVSAGANTAWKRTANLSPSRPLLEELAFEAGGREITVLVADASGRELAKYVRKSGAQAEVLVTLPPHVEPGKTAENAEGQWRIGTDFEKLGEPDAARLHYGEALRLDPAYSPALTALAVLEIRQGVYGAAMKRLRAVLEADPAQESARFHLGACLLDCGRFDEAAAELGTLMRSTTYRPGASYLLGGILLGQGQAERAFDQLDKCAFSFPWRRDAIAFSACALRKLNRRDEAEERVRGTMAEDPLHMLSRAEAFFLGHQDALPRHAPVLLELACEYARFAMVKEAHDILSLCDQDDPLVHYHLGYYAEKLGQSDAASCYRKGAAADPAYVFPHRVESEQVLRRALEVFPDDGRASYFLGNLLASKDRAEEAINCWQEAVKTQGSFSVLRRNLGRAFWKIRHDADAAVAEYRRAIECAPNDYKPYLELDTVLIASGREQDRARLFSCLAPGLMGNDLIAERYAAWLADTQDFQGALEVIARTYFYPWEVYKGVRFLYVDCCIGRGIQLLGAGELKAAMASFRSVMEYPRTIGVGESRWKANAEAWYRIGLAQRESGDTAAARASWTRAAEEPRPVPDPLSYYRARALKELGRTEGARLALEDLLTKRHGGGAEDHYLAGLAFKGMGRNADASRSFTAALSLAPGHRRSRWEQSGFTGET